MPTWKSMHFFSYHFSIFHFPSFCAHLPSPAFSQISPFISDLSSLPSSSFYPHSLSHLFFIHSLLRSCVRFVVKGEVDTLPHTTTPPPTCRPSRRHPSCIDFVHTSTSVCVIHRIIINTLSAIFFAKRQLTINSPRSFLYRQLVLTTVRNAFIRYHCIHILGWCFPAWWLSNH